MKIKLSKTERLILANQYKILNEMFPNQSFDEFEEVLRDGYSNHYSEIFQDIYDEQPEAHLEQVRDVLSLYDALQRSVDALGSNCKLNKNDVEFPGYDGNNETSLMGYAQFLQKTGHWNYVQTAQHANSHCRMFQRYEKQLAKWENLGKKYDLTESEINDILS